MAAEMDVAFRGMEASEAVRAELEKRVERLNNHNPDVRRVSVVIEQAHRSQSQGNPFSVSLEVKIPGVNDVYVSHDPGGAEEREDLYIAIRDAFEAAERQLEKRRAKH